MGRRQRLWDFLQEKGRTLLLLLGIVTLVFILATLFTPLTENNPRITSSVPLSVGTPEFRRTVESVAGSVAEPLDGKMQIFADGTAFLNDLIAEIDNAERSVTITNYIFSEGHMTDETFDALARAAERGVLVRLLLDDHGGNKAPKEKLEAIEKAGGKVTRFRPVSFRTITRVHRRSHVRAISIDGERSYLGGMAFNDEWLGVGVGETNWRDLMFKFSGTPARAIADQFNTLWRQTDGEILAGDPFYPPLQASEVKPDSYFISLLHAPAPDISYNLLDLIWLSIAGAKKHVLLATPYLTPPHEIIKALDAAVKRGVEIEVLVPGPHTDSIITQGATRSYYEELLDMGVKIYEYQPGRFHAKFLTVDGEWSLVGSANMDNRSATLNVENVFGIEDKSFAKALEDEFAFERDNARERTRENFRPTLLKEMWYRLTALFAKQF